MLGLSSLASPSAAVGRAVQQFLAGDIRYAQWLAVRGEPGIRAELDVTRAGPTSWGAIGFGAFGMRFFAERLAQSSTFAVQTPGGALSGLADRLESGSGAFFSRHGFARTVLSGVEAPRDRAAIAQTNLYYAWTDEDEFMERDKVMANVGGLLIPIVGTDGWGTFAPTLREIAHAVQEACAPAAQSAVDDACVMSVVGSPQISAMVGTATAAFEAALPSALPEQEKAIARQAFSLAVATSRAYEHAAIWTGPGAAATTEMFLSNEAVGQLMARGGADVAARVAAVDPSADRDELDSIARSVDGWTAEYRALDAIAGQAVAKAGQIGWSVLTVRVPVEGNRPLYESMVVTTLAAERAGVVTRMVDGLREELDAMHWRLGADRPERTLGAALLALVASDLRDYRFEVRTDVDEDASDPYWLAGYRPTFGGAHRGSHVRLFGEAIGWDVQKLLDVERE